MKGMYQRFDIDQERFRGGKLGPEDRKRLVNPLREKGYQVLEGLTTIGSIPTEIIVGAPENKLPTIKEDFYRLAREIDVPFTSGSVYIGNFPTGLWSRLEAQSLREELAEERGEWTGEDSYDVLFGPD
ncbi:hypothetical protein COU60_04290 [Candidatus Pacearchaeota archaeon CG10_big_fil_rev_8_21_14_0_10_34_76]|nr:MAG: hypothetical protein COU60_04290 [Candidatus Pacearchaeota archaeon CG10_big_fil_rev_8_21_14_0_10_34_76]